MILSNSLDSCDGEYIIPPIDHSEGDTDSVVTSVGEIDVKMIDCLLFDTVCPGVILRIAVP